jgi:hypothetical protein
MEYTGHLIDSYSTGSMEFTGYSHCKEQAVWNIQDTYVIITVQAV